MLLKTQQHMTAAMLLPSIEVPKFKGDPIEFANFMMAFDARIAPNASGDADKLYYLDQQLEGEAKDLIGGCLYMSSSEGYTTARICSVKSMAIPTRSCQQKSKSSSFATQAELNPENRKTSIVSEKEKSCPMCKKIMILTIAGILLRRPLKKKIDFLKERRLCFGCFGLNHTSKGCMKRKQCKTCSKRHPTSLHIDGFKLHKENDSSSSKEASEIIVSTCTTNHVSEVNTILQAILPVKVYQKGNKVVLDTYAFFDNGSTGCFITESLREQIGASGTETCLKLQTMHGVNIVNTFGG
ncbi:uncharacterized protein [Macrobrachium rosenbergii]|uniref:uncharacterized protein n=1 Tax=Macrobrachium rosenbergii TaxID=79674 RepID=UPI0034D53C51